MSDAPKMDSHLAFSLKALQWAWKFAPKVLRPALVEVRNQVIFTTANLVHQECIHSIKRFSVVCRTRGLDFGDTGTIAEAIRSLAAHLLKVSSHDIHVTIKLIIEGLEVKTIGRSSESNRCHEWEGPVSSVQNNSDFAALFGCSDGKNEWKAPFNTFHCPDLSKERNYVCSRPDFENCYKTSLVLPLRIEDLSRPEYKVFGFVTLDSLKPALFRMPNIFDFTGDKRPEYAAQLSRSNLFQALGAVVDSLSMVLQFFVLPLPVRPSSLLSTDTTLIPKQ